MKKNDKQRLFGLRGKRQRGYTLLEYCAGAAVLAGIVWAAISTLGTSMEGYLNQLSAWLDQRADDIEVQETTP